MGDVYTYEIEVAGVKHVIECTLEGLERAFLHLNTVNVGYKDWVTLHFSEMRYKAEVTLNFREYQRLKTAVNYLYNTTENKKYDLDKLKEELYGQCS